MIKIKDTTVMVALLKVSYDLKLIEILAWLFKLYPNQVFTDGFRKDDPKCHGTDPCRAVDLRSKTFKNPMDVRDLINATWEYDFRRSGRYKVCKYHKVDNGGWHFHIQVHPNTRRQHET